MAPMLGDKYVLGDLIGSGGMGMVYAAEQPCLGRTVAVKLMRSEFTSDAYMLRRFHTEAIVGSRLHHRNVAAVFDYGSAGDAPYLVMEYVRGKLLSSILASEGPLRVRRAAQLVGDLLAALAEAHAARIVHADVKTDNVIVEKQRDGSELGKLIDFGLARFMDDPCAPPLEEAMLSGTPEYLAPELILGGVPTPASDVYGAAIVLYELLTGETPFAGGSAAEILSRHLEEEVVLPSLRNPDREIPAGLEAVILRALAKDPTARFMDAGQFREALIAATPTHDVAVHSASSRRAFRAETTTCRLSHNEMPVHTAKGTRPHPTRDLAVLRTAIGGAIVSGDVHRLVSGYLELARALVDDQDLRTAARELVEAIDIISQGQGANAPDAPEPMWRLLLTLAAVYDGLGDRKRAAQAAEAGHALAERRSSSVGRERAHALLERLARARAGKGGAPIKERP